MHSTFRLIILGVALSLTGCGQLSGAKIAKRLKPSMVLVRTDGGHGTAFFVRGKSGVCTLVTAAHVVRGKQMVRLETADGKQHEPQQILPLDRDLDLAVMTFAPRQGGGCVYPPLKLGDSDGVEELDAIYISGFPGRSAGEPVRQTIPTVVTGFGNLPQGYGIGYKGELYGGMSGGPVLDRQGKVVAVHGSSDRRLVELYDAQGQANLPPQELTTVRQAEQRVQSGVFVNTFKWGIPINLYLRNRPAAIVPDGAGISSTFAWFLFGSGAVAGGLLVYFGAKPLTPTAEAEGRRRREAEANARTLQEQVRNLEKQLGEARRQHQEETKQRQQAEAAAQRERGKAKRGKQAEANLGPLQNQVQTLEGQLAEARRQQREEAKKRQQVEASAQRLSEQVRHLQEQQAETPTPKAAASRQEVELKSAKGVDYRKLRDLLAAKDWKEADEETWRVMCLAAGREKERWLEVEDIDNFPCEDLRTIDRLWLKYSDGRFGFSVQKDIYQELGGTREYDLKIWEAFGDRVGWRQGGRWLDYGDMAVAPTGGRAVAPTGAGETSPRGHLPAISPRVRYRGISFLAPRLVTCSKL